MNDRLKYRYWQHTDWHDTNSPLEAVYCNAVDGCDPTIAVSDFEFCTGMKDKNGNLIYEGDIIRYCVNWRAYCLTYTRIVAWDKNTAGFIMVNGKTQVKPLQKWKFPDPETHIIEIVGNIHKQPEQKDKQ